MIQRALNLRYEFTIDSKLDSNLLKDLLNEVAPLCFLRHNRFQGANFIESISNKYLVFLLFGYS